MGGAPRLVAHLAALTGPVDRIGGAVQVVADEPAEGTVDESTILATQYRYGKLKERTRIFACVFALLRGD